TAKVLEYGASQRGSAMGTPSYMSPEQIKGKAVDGRTDIFSLGVMLYELTTGQKPFHGQDVATVLYKILNEQPAPPHQLNPSIPTGVSSAILKALTKSPHLRYDNCNDLLEDLKHYRPSVVGSDTSVGRTANSIPAPRPGTTQKVDKKYHVEVPRIPGVEPRPTRAASSSAPPATPLKLAVDSDSLAAPQRQPGNVYAEPAAKMDIAQAKRIGTIAAGVLLVLMLGSFAIKTFKRTRQPDLDALPAQSSEAPGPPQNVVPEPVERPP